MELFLVPNNPERTVLVSPNGVAHYQVTTSKPKLFGAPGVSRIKRPAETEEDSIVAEIEWKAWGTHTVVRSALLPGAVRSESDGCSCLAAREFLYKRHPFSSCVALFKIFSFRAHPNVGSSSSRYFLGNDDQEYRWKAVDKGDMVVRTFPFSPLPMGLRTGPSLLQLTHSDTRQEVARIVHCLTGQGLFEGERKCCLRVQPCSVDIDLVVLSCLLMEKKRRDRAGDGTTLAAHDEDPQGDGGAGAEGGG